MEEFGPIAQWLQENGAYGLVAILGVAFWKINERKDAALRELYQRVAEIGRTQTEATLKVESSLMALKETIEEMQPTRPRRRFAPPAEHSAPIDAGSPPRPGRGR